MLNNDSQTKSIAESFAERVQSSHMLSSRTSVMYNQQGQDASHEIAEFKVQIQKRFIMSVANKYYSFPFTQLSFDNPFQDQELNDLIGIDILNLHEIKKKDNNRSIKKDNNENEQNNQIQKNVDFTLILKQIKADRQRFTEILSFINNKKNVQNEDRNSKSKQKRLQFKYGIIKEQDQQLLRKRLYTQPNEKQAGFIIKKK